MAAITTWTWSVRAMAPAVAPPGISTTAYLAICLLSGADGASTAAARIPAVVFLSTTIASTTQDQVISLVQAALGPAAVAAAQASVQALLDSGNPSPSFPYDPALPWAPAPTPQPPVVPLTVAMWQAKAALQATTLPGHSPNLLTEASQAIAAANNATLTAFWAGSATIDRASPTLATLAAALGLSKTQVDALFIQASSIVL